MISWDDVRALEQDVRELEQDYWVEEESEEQARERMSPEEALADLQFALVAQWRQPHPGRAARARRMKRRGGMRRAGR